MCQLAWPLKYVAFLSFVEKYEQTTEGPEGLGECFQKVRKDHLEIAAKLGPSTPRPCAVPPEQWLQSICDEGQLTVWIDTGGEINVTFFPSAHGAAPVITLGSADANGTFRPPPFSTGALLVRSGQQYALHTSLPAPPPFDYGPQADTLLKRLPNIYVLVLDSVSTFALEALFPETLAVLAGIGKMTNYGVAALASWFHTIQWGGTLQNLWGLLGGLDVDGDGANNLLSLLRRRGYRTGVFCEVQDYFCQKLKDEGPADDIFPFAVETELNRLLTDCVCGDKRCKQCCVGRKLFVESLLEFGERYIRDSVVPTFVFVRLYGYHATRIPAGLPMVDKAVARHISSMVKAESTNGDIIFFGSDHGRLNSIYMCEQQSPFLSIMKSPSAIVDQLFFSRLAFNSSRGQERALMAQHHSRISRILKLYSVNLQTHGAQSVVTWFDVYTTIMHATTRWHGIWPDLSPFEWPTTVNLIAASPATRFQLPHLLDSSYRPLSFFSKPFGRNCSESGVAKDICPSGEGFTSRVKFCMRAEKFHEITQAMYPVSAFAPENSTLEGALLPGLPHRDFWGSVCDDGFSSWAVRKTLAFVNSILTSGDPQMRCGRFSDSHAAMEVVSIDNSIQESDEFNYHWRWRIVAVPSLGANFQWLGQKVVFDAILLSHISSLTFGKLVHQGLEKLDELLNASSVNAKFDVRQATVYGKNIPCTPPDVPAEFCSCIPGSETWTPLQ